MKTIRLLMFMLLLALPALACGIGRSEPEPTPAPTSEPTLEPTQVPTAEPTAEPTPEPTPVPAAALSLDAEYTSDFMGVTFSHPADWVVQDFFLIFMATSEELLTAFLESDEPPDNIDNDALAFLVSGGYDEFDSADPQSILDETIEDFDLLEDGGRIVEGPTQLTVNGLQITYVILEGEADDGYELSVFYAIIADDAQERVTALIGVTSPVGMPTFKPTFLAIAESVEMSAPDVSFDFDFDTGSVFYGFPETGVVTDEEPVRFVFFGIAGDVIDIIVDPKDGFDAVVDVLDENGDSILPFGEVDDSFGREEIRGLVIENTGDYIIAIRGYAGDTGSFELIVNESSGIESNLLGPGIEILISGGFDANGSNIFMFSAETDMEITAVVDPLDGLDVVVSILDFDTEETLVEVDRSFGQETLTYFAEETALYLLVVEGYNGEAGDYLMTVTVSPGLIFELVDGAIVNGWYDENSKHEFVVFLDEGQTLALELTPEDYDAVVEITDLDDNVLLRMDDGFSGEAELLTFIAPADDVYFVVSRAFSSAINGRYSMVVVILD